MRKAVAIPMAFALLAACGGDGEPSGAKEVVETEIAAADAGDASEMASFWSDDAVFVLPDGTEVGVWEHSEFPIDDFDGDGTPSMADLAQVESAMAPTFERTTEVECTELSETEVECNEYRSDVFVRLAGIEDPGIVHRTETVDDLIVRRTIVGGVEGDFEAVDEFDATVGEQSKAYEQWIFDNHRELHPKMYGGSCCVGIPAATQEAVELHAEMLPQYLETLEA